MSDWRTESLGDENGKEFTRYVADLTTRIGLQFVNMHSAVRIKNLGAAGGSMMNDDLVFETLSKFPAGVTADCFMNRRSLEQLRRSRPYVTSPTGVPSLPDSVGGMGFDCEHGEISPSGNRREHETSSGKIPPAGFLDADVINA